MTDKVPFAAVILAAGQGTRMKSTLPKVLHPLAGRPLIAHVAAALAPLAPAKVVAVVAPGQEAVAKAAGTSLVAIQNPPLGTGHAVLAAQDVLAGFEGDVLICFGDTPLIRTETVKAMRAALARPDRPGVVVLGFRPADPAAYGRLVTAADGTLERIVEFKDATPAERAIGLCNAGVMAVAGKHLFALLAQVKNDNAKGEYYLTDIVGLARAQGLGCTVVEGHEDEVLGINSRAELAEAETILQRRLRAHWLAEGVTMADPATVWFSWDTELAADVTLEPNVVFAPMVKVARGARIRAFSHLEGCNVGPGAIIGPFARLRPGADLADDVHIGNFVEIKNAKVESGAKVNHLSYVGDARVGAKANVGAGTITCNYDGFGKYHTDIGAGAFIGSDTALVAPVKVGDGAITGAGSVITKDVPANALAVERSALVLKDGWAAGFRARKRAEKEKSGKKG